MTEIAKPAVIPTNRKPGTLHSFFALKFHEGDEDKAKVGAIEKALNEAGITITLMARDVEKWGKAEIPKGKTLMTDYAFPAMRQCDCNIIEFSEKGVGLGINAGYCYAIGKPIFVIAKTGSDISTTISNLATKVIFYNTPKDLIKPFKEIVASFPRIILASKSSVRRQQMIDAGLSFEVIVSNADETPDQSKSLKDQLADISMRKAQAVFETTKDDRGVRLIVAADQNIMFENQLYGKPKSINEARKLLRRMRGSKEVYFYTGNAVLLVRGSQILDSINITDVARTSVDNLSDTEIEDYLALGTWSTFCGGININNAPFVHLSEGRTSTAKGMTIEYAEELLKSYMDKITTTYI